MRGDQEKEVDVGRGDIATHGLGLGKDWKESAGETGDRQIRAHRWTGGVRALQKARTLSQAWSDSPALIPVVSWVAAEAAAGGCPWGLEGGQGAVDPPPRAPGGKRGCRI